MNKINNCLNLAAGRLFYSTNMITSKSRLKGLDDILSLNPLNYYSKPVRFKFRRKGECFFFFENVTKSSRDFLFYGEWMWFTQEHWKPWVAVIIVVKNINIFSPSQVLVVSEMFIFLFKEKTVERKLNTSLFFYLKTNMLKTFKAKWFNGYFFIIK